MFLQQKMSPVSLSCLVTIEHSSGSVHMYSTAGSLEDNNYKVGAKERFIKSNVLYVVLDQTLNLVWGCLSMQAFGPIRNMKIKFSINHASVTFLGIINIGCKGH